MYDAVRRSMDKNPRDKDVSSRNFRPRANMYNAAFVYFECIILIVVATWR